MDLKVVTATPTSSKELSDHLAPLASATVLALDYETQGLGLYDDECRAVGMGLSDGKVSVYLPILDLTPALRGELYDWLQQRQLVGHNINFDGAFYLKECGRHANWAMCTSGFFRQIAAEGWYEQNWSLKTAMVDVLGWDEPNTADLYDWLKKNGLGKGDMWQAPVEILGRYCALDTAATFHLYEYFLTFEPRFPVLFDYHRNDFLTLVRHIINQGRRGIRIDRLPLMKHRTTLAQKLAQIEAEFRSHELMRAPMERWREANIEDWLAREPERLKKDGTPTVRWQAWKNREEEVRRGEGFSLTSKDHLAWLFYENLYEARITNPGAPKAGRKKLTFREKGRGEVIVDGERHELLLTDGGKLPVDRNILPFLGPLGKLLVQYNDVAKEMGYVDACLTLSAKDGILHPSFKVPGTITGRLSGGLES